MTPDNAAYYHAAYIAAAVLYSLYAGSLWWRSRRLSERERTLAGQEDAGGDGR